MKACYLLIFFVLILESKGVKPPKDRLAFAEVIVPIMEEKCHSCHSEAKDKGKGGSVDGHLRKHVDWGR